MKTAVQLESKDIRHIIARFLDVPEENVIPQRYGFSVVEMTAGEIEERINKNPDIINQYNA